MSFGTPAPHVRSVELAGGRGTLSVCVYGDPDALPLLLLHGGGLTARSWQRVSASLIADYCCIAPDLLGHGDSTWSEDGEYSIAEYAKDIAELVEALELPPLPVVGHSLGGLIATAFASRSTHPTAVVLVDVGLEPRQEGAKNVVHFMEDTRSPYASIDDLVEEALRFNPRRDATILRDTLQQNMLQLGDGRWRWKYDQRFFPSRVGGFEEERVELRAAASRIECPMLIIRGRDSRVLTEDAAVRTAARFSDSRVATVAEAGHTPHGDNPDGFLDVLVPFLHALRDGTVVARSNSADGKS